TVVQRATDSEDAFIITGCVIDNSLGEEIRVTVLATGFHGHGGPGNLFHSEPAQQPRTMRSVSSGGQPTPAPAPTMPHTAAPAPAAQQPSNDLDIPPFLRNAGRRP